MDNRPVNAYIPPNLSSNGGIAGGMFDLRKIIEAIIGVVFSVIMFLLLKELLPLKVAGYIALAIAVPLGGVGLIGIGGEPFSVFIFNLFNYEQRRIFVTLRPPMPVAGRKHPAAEEGDDEAIGENKLVRLLRGGRK